MLETLFQLWPKPIYSLVLIKCFGTILFYYIFFIIIIITKKIKTNIKSVLGEKCFERMQLQQRGANTCTLFITVTLICLCDSCTISQMPQHEKTFFHCRWVWFPRLSEEAVLLLTTVETNVYFGPNLLFLLLIPITKNPFLWMTYSVHLQISSVGSNMRFLTVRMSVPILIKPFAWYQHAKWGSVR